MEFSFKTELAKRLMKDWNITFTDALNYIQDMEEMKNEQNN